jgi:predicted GH43/DUF377 family glycosyl hydrolase
MLAWEKLGRIFNPLDVTDRNWMKEFSQAPSALVLDDVVRVYFACRPAPDDTGQYVSLSAFVEFRRDNLLDIVRVCEQPLLELGAPGTFDEFGTYFTSVARKDGLVLAYYVGYTRCESVPFTIAIGAAVSDDGGETFRRLGRGPILPCTVDEPFFLTVPKIRQFGGQWYLWYSAGKKWLAGDGRPEPVYQIRMATSTDALNWRKLGRDIVACKLEDECQASPDVFYLDSRYHMLFCYRHSLNYRCKEGGYRIGYASSDDLVNWVRDDSRAGIGISDAGWDAEMVSFPHVFELDGNHYLLYLGNQMGRYGFGLARLASYTP